MDKKLRECPYCCELIHSEVDKCEFCCEETGFDFNKVIQISETKTCPFCCEDISENVLICQHCNSDLAEETIDEQLNYQKDYYENNSGMGNATIIPENIRGWNWGAFFFTWIWGIANKCDLSLFALIPFFNFIWGFVCGAKGNEWAWKNKQWSSIEEFHRVQRSWASWGLGLFLFSVLIGSIFWIFIITNANNYQIPDNNQDNPKYSNPNNQTNASTEDRANNSNDSYKETSNKSSANQKSYNPTSNTSSNDNNNKNTYVQQEANIKRSPEIKNKINETYAQNNSQNNDNQATQEKDMQKTENLIMN